jgi:hypothetical protein
VVTTYEQVFEIIHEAHIKLKHGRDVRENKSVSMMIWGIMVSLSKLFSASLILVQW